MMWPLLLNTSIKNCWFYGISSGALKAALFTQRHPERVARLALDAFRLDRRRQPDRSRSAGSGCRVPVEKPPPDRSRFRAQASSSAITPATADEATIEAFANRDPWRSTTRCDRHLRRHVLEAAARRPGRDQRADARPGAASSTASPASTISSSSTAACLIRTSSSR